MFALGNYFGTFATDSVAGVRGAPKTAVDVFPADGLQQTVSPCLAPCLERAQLAQALHRFHSRSSMLLERRSHCPQ